GKHDSYNLSFDVKPLIGGWRQMNFVVCRSEFARDCFRGHADNREQARSYIRQKDIEASQRGRRVTTYFEATSAQAC
ncbi:MAG TPA: hypothetical protein VM532_12610, partial [Burkholderiales bacterium]|nr:hypothetical protein [Burkholderiales bacterium]